MKQFDSSLLHDKLKEYFGFSSFKGNQEAVIRNVLEGKDTFVLMPTGGGKSLCYQLPAMLMDGVAIVISPLIALMKNQVDAMRTFSAESGIAHFLNSSLNKTAVAQVRQDVLDGKTKLLYFAPESLTKEDNVSFLRQIKIKIRCFHIYILLNNKYDFLQLKPASRLCYRLQSTRHSFLIRRHASNLPGCFLLCC